MPNSTPSLTSDPGGRPKPDCVAPEQAGQEIQRLLSAVREEKDRLLSLLNSISDEVWFTDTNRKFTLANPAALRAFGLDPTQGIGVEQLAASLEVLRPDGSPRPVEEAPPLRALQGETVRDLEERVRTPGSGELRYRQVSAAPVRDAQGAIIGSVSVVRDITERKRAEDALRFVSECGWGPSGEDFFRALARYLAQSLGADFVCIDRLEEGSLTAQTVAVFCDGKFQDNVSYTLMDTPCGDVVGKTICCFPRDVRHLFPKDLVLQEMLAEGYVGTTLWSSVGQPIGLIALIWRQPLADTRLATSVLQQVAVRAAGELERRQAEAKLRESEERYRLLYDRNPDGVFAVDTTGRFVMANPACEVITGYSTAELQQRTFMEICAPDQLARTVESFARGLRESISLELETALLRKDGRRVEIWVAGEQLTVDQKTVVHCTAKDLTERKWAEEALRKSDALALSEKEFRLLAEAMPQIVWATRADGWNTYFNQQWVDYTGLTLEESYGHGWNRPFHPDDQQRAWEAWQNAVTNRATYALECRLRRADGTYRWWLIRGVPVLDEKGHILKWFGTCTDINDLKQAEEALREAGEERLRLVLEATSMGTFEIDLRTGEGHWNTVEFELLGLKPGDAPSVPATFFRYLHPDDAARVQAQWAEATQTGILNTEFRIVRADGQVRWLAGLGRFAYAGKPDDSAPEGKPEPVGFLGVNFDITERKQMEAALRESESRYRAIGESIDYGVWVCAPDGRNIYASPSFLKLVGLTQEQCSNFGWGDVLHPDDTARTIAAWKECVRTGAKWDIEHRFRGVDGQYHPVLARGVPVRNDRGEIVCWAGINLDISRLKEAEEGVRRRAEELRATNEELNRFNEAMVGRELRMIELKQEIDTLCAQFGQPLRYGPQADDQARPKQ
jgi:PAS domain S-box-containing protein